MTTHLVETGRHTLSHADLWVTAETAERWVKFCQEVCGVRKQQHGLEERRWVPSAELPPDLHLSQMVLALPAGCSSSCSGSVLTPRCRWSAFLLGADR